MFTLFLIVCLIGVVFSYNTYNHSKNLVDILGGGFFLLPFLGLITNHTQIIMPVSIAYCILYLSMIHQQEIITTINVYTSVIVLCIGIACISRGIDSSFVLTYIELYNTINLSLWVLLLLCTIIRWSRDILFRSIINRTGLYSWRSMGIYAGI